MSRKGASLGEARYSPPGTLYTRATYVRSSNKPRAAVPTPGVLEMMRQSTTSKPFYISPRPASTKRAASVVRTEQETGRLFPKFPRDRERLFDGSWPHQWHHAQSIIPSIDAQRREARGGSNAHSCSVRVDNMVKSSKIIWRKTGKCEYFVPNRIVNIKFMGSIQL